MKHGGWITRFPATLSSVMIEQRPLARRRPFLPPSFFEGPKKRGGSGLLCLMLIVTPMLAVIAMLMNRDFQQKQKSSLSQPCKSHIFLPKSAPESISDLLKLKIFLGDLHLCAHVHTLVHIQLNFLYRPLAPLARDSLCVSRANLAVGGNWARFWMKIFDCILVKTGQNTPQRMVISVPLSTVSRPILA